MSQRRQRYTLAVEGRSEPVVALAYNAQGAVSAANRRGMKVTKVTQGDYRKKARARAAKANGGYTFNQAAIAQARRTLGITWSVKIYKDSRIGGTDGKARMIRTPDGQITIKVMVKSYLTPERATFVLWHELRHVKQMQDAGSWDAWAKITKHQRQWPYRVRPIEVEANQTARTMSPNHPLAR